jgi:hypothetical protein
MFSLGGKAMFTEEMKAEDQKELALEFIQSWGPTVIDDHEEPRRMGVPKGSRIGVSRKKLAAAIYSVAYPLVPLEEIAELSGTTLGSLKTWRTLPDFKNLCSQWADELARRICRTIDVALMFWDLKTGAITSINEWDDKPAPKLPDQDYELFQDSSPDYSLMESGPVLFMMRNLLDDPIEKIRYLTNVVTCLNFSIQRKVQDFMFSKSEQAIRMERDSVYPVAHLFLVDAMIGENLKRKSLLRFLDIKTAMISIIYDRLMSPEMWTPENSQRAVELAEKLKKQIFSMIEVLAGKKTTRSEDADGE